MTELPKEARHDAEGSATYAADHPGLPTWVKVSGLVLAMLVAALIIAMLLAGGEHGPGRHGAFLG